MLVNFILMFPEGNTNSNTHFLSMLNLLTILCIDDFKIISSRIGRKKKLNSKR